MKERYPYDRTWIKNMFTVIADRIEVPISAAGETGWRIADLESALRDLKFDVWGEGTGLVVLGRLSG